MVPEEENAQPAEDEGEGPVSGDGGEGVPAGDDESKNVRRREGALARLKRELADRETPVPQLERYPLVKARKILALCDIPAEKVRIRYVQSDEEQRGTVVAQVPRQGEKLNFAKEGSRIELQVADQSLLRFLPGILQRSDLSGRNFLGEVLWVFQHLHNETDEKLQNLHDFFDPLECPPHFLEWLASWVALSIEDAWPEAKKRNLIKKAVELYHLRGTPRGLRVYLRIFTGVDPVIEENAWPYDGITVGINSTVGEDTVIMHAVNRAHTFIVHIPLPIDDVPVPIIQKIHRIIEHEKPVHTDYFLVFAAEEGGELADEGFTVGVSSTVGVDTWMTGEDAEAYRTMDDDADAAE